MDELIKTFTDLFQNGVTSLPADTNMSLFLPKNPMDVVSTIDFSSTIHIINLGLIVIIGLISLRLFIGVVSSTIKLIRLIIHKA